MLLWNHWNVNPSLCQLKRQLLVLAGRHLFLRLAGGSFLCLGAAPYESSKYIKRSLCKREGLTECLFLWTENKHSHIHLQSGEVQPSFYLDSDAHIKLATIANKRENNEHLWSGYYKQAENCPQGSPYHKPLGVHWARQLLGGAPVRHSLLSALFIQRKGWQIRKTGQHLGFP